MNIIIRKFQIEDIPYKVRWINDERNNRYLHYDLPLMEDRTLLWYKSLNGRDDRIDCTIICDNEPAGLIGLLNIDNKNKKAEYYICIGEEKFKGKGIAFNSTVLLINTAYMNYGLHRIYLFTEVDNVRAQILFEQIGFEREGLLRNDLIYNGRSIDRYVYGLDVKNYMRNAGEINNDKSN